MFEEAWLVEDGEPLMPLSVEAHGLATGDGVSKREGECKEFDNSYSSSASVMEISNLVCTPRWSVA
ncbi:hypothetical protein J6590_031651 [Homalodisca vitripennis]|nr:hypothetical protein J6590_031651 [Homalodisca vitripennis]